MDESIRELFGWVVGICVLLAGVALGLIVAGLVHLAAGAGAGRDEPLPPGVLRHAQELESRLRRRYMPRPMSAEPLVLGWPEPPLRVMEGGREATAAGAGSAGGAAAA